MATKLRKLIKTTTLADADLIYVVVPANPPGDGSRGIVKSDLKTQLEVTHTGEVTGTTALSLDKTAITNQSTVTAVGSDTVMIIDATDGELKKSLISDFASAGGTVTSVAVSGSDGVQVDSGSPITSSGTIALGIDKTALLTHINVEDGADVTDNANVNAAGVIEYFMEFAFGDETTDLTVSTANITFDMPDFATTLTKVSVNVVTAPTGSVATFDLNEAGTTVLSTKVTIDATEKSSETAATAPVISDSALAANATMSVDTDGIGSTIAGAGGKMIIYFERA